VNIPCKFCRDCSSLPWDIVVTRSDTIVCPCFKNPRWRTENERTNATDRQPRNIMHSPTLSVNERMKSKARFGHFLQPPAWKRSMLYSYNPGARMGKQTDKQATHYKWSPNYKYCLCFRQYPSF